LGEVAMANPAGRESGCALSNPTQSGVKGLRDAANE
jgi:hypothetical protein